MLHSRQRPVRPGLTWLVSLTILFFLLFGSLTVYQIIARGREIAEADKERPLVRPVFKHRIQWSSVQDWPQWRGPQRNGKSDETDQLDEWPEEGPRKVWEQPSGDGYSSVVVARGRAFTMVQDGPDEVLLCWRSDDGQKVWRFAYPCQYRNQFGNGPRATPTIAGEHIYCVGAKGNLHCVQAFGETPQKVWELDLLERFRAPEPQWGFSGSPLVEGDLVYVQPGGPNGNSVVALHKDTGKVVWHRHDYPAGYSSPIAGTFAGQRQILFFTGTHLIGVVPETGELLWEYFWPTANHCNIATPILIDDYILITSGYEMGAAFLQIDKTDSGWHGNEVYKTRRLRDQFSTPVLYDKHVYGFDEASLVCLELSTGKVCWKQRGFEKGSLLAADGRLIVYGSNGLLALVKANPKSYDEMGRFRCSQQEASCWSVPALADGRLYIRDQEKVTCYDLKKGR
jgi:outer membrane protein assembly factor BamB